MKWIPAIAPPTNLTNVAGLVFVSNPIVVSTKGGDFRVAIYQRIPALIYSAWVCTVTQETIQNVQEWTHIIKD
jgi:hypothetical protein